MMKSNLTFRPTIASKVIHPFVSWDNVFNPMEIDNIIKYCDSIGTQPGPLFNDSGNEVDDSIRKAEVNFHYINDSNRWIFEGLRNAVEFINNDFFRFDLTGFEFFQYSVYDGAGAHYDFHMDMLMGENMPPSMSLCRKLSFSLVLSEPGVDFTGGEFECKIGEKFVAGVEQKKGRLIAFPSFMLHKVAPIKTGIRKSIVLWVTGPKFK